MVSGATGTCFSSLAPSARTQPSGVVTRAGVPGGTEPSAEVAAPTGCAGSGSAVAGGVFNNASETAKAAARRTTAEFGITGFTLRTVPAAARIAS
ncbi:hypothetical protein Mkiyose1665_27810 [Mycobacterium kiyosense]|uniref:Uncharacterized protein n=1 Tax=Mycobacterium kiyosense TaxID=2871094 RepID=A0A9P3UU44_9MYCO|nr:hypothetical protein IWGMT90018_17370 [Mycobacterium kiyosense]BDE13046.1 hypothetical protein MKCMC460_19060 [Mycobacterium sp. 20KCMC460]GLB82004.1 hypothetical protein SRL2020028_12600 [Mycobacterium kiyosense]GLB89515.1 hypothetical protein SRL2020130_23320 [Mycobacterium kiyosense]GLB95146.1 hypothetical protein SRL2020226_19220 [Mycobacterium kiyosense]